MREARTGRRVHSGLAAPRPTLSPSDLRASVVDRARRRRSPPPAHRHASHRRAGLRVHDQPRRAHGGGPLHDGLLGSLFAGGDALCGRLRPVSAIEGRLRRARDGVDSSLAEADGLHVSRAAGVHQGWKSKAGLLPSDYWRRNMFVEFMEDDLGVQLRDTIGVDNMLWGSDFPHAESTWPKSRQFLDRIFAGTPETDLRKITAENAARLFGFALT